MKTCYRCKLEKPLEEFYKRSDKPDGRQNRCKKCDYARYLERLAENPEEVRRIGRESARRNRRRQIYGITNDEYDAMVLDREGRCDICGEAPAKLFVEHCHSTRKIRGLACLHCNSVLGYARDEPARLRAAADYLERHAVSTLVQA